MVRPRNRAGAPRISRPIECVIEYEVSGMLRLGGSMDQKLEIVAKLPQPSRDIGGLIADDLVRNSGFSTQVGSPHFGRQLFLGIYLRAERHGFQNPFARKAFLTYSAMNRLVHRRRIEFLRASEQFAWR